MRRFLAPVAALTVCIICGLLLGIIIAQPTKDLRSDLVRWIKPEALTDEGRAALRL